MLGCPPFDHATHGRILRRVRHEEGQLKTQNHLTAGAETGCVTVLPSFAIVHPRTPICQGWLSSGGAAGETSAVSVLRNNPPEGHPMPAQGAAHLAGHSPGAFAGLFQGGRLRSQLRATSVRLAGLLIAGALILSAACGGDEEPTATLEPAATSVQGATTASEIVNFTLEDLTVTVGTTVNWTNGDRAEHTVTAGTPGNIAPDFRSSRLNTGEAFSHKFSTAGVFQYFCEVHPSSMRATITVQ